MAREDDLLNAQPENISLHCALLRRITTAGDVGRISHLHESHNFTVVESHLSPEMGKDVAWALPLTVEDTHTQKNGEQRFVCGRAKV